MNEHEDIGIDDPAKSIDSLGKEIASNHALHVAALGGLSSLLELSLMVTGKSYG
jgi:hypothetical protein